MFMSQVNPKYESTYVFDNDFPTLLSGCPEKGLPLFIVHALVKCFPYLVLGEDEHPLLRSETVTGRCQVMCFHPHSDITLPLMSLPEIRAVIDKWAEINIEEGQKHQWVQVHLDLL
jgi:UDPglucose--hexose-1-phosphate uridylyltransferase